MSGILAKVVPWGRSLEEYVRMFDLSAADLKGIILDCGGGPASFCAEMHQRGGRVVACDPIYQFSAAEIRGRVNDTYEMMVSAARDNREKFMWREIESPEHLGKLRMRAMELFLEDYPAGISQGRYRVAELPVLPFRDGEFDLALCSHFLFTYSNLLTLEFHLASIRELCRVAREARIFPLFPNFANEHSPYVAQVVGKLGAEGYRCEICRVPYEFQKGGNEMLRVSQFPTLKLRASPVSVPVGP